MNRKIAFFSLIILITSCNINAKTNKNSSSDNIESHIDSIQKSSFMNYFESFMWDKNLQVNSVNFPIKVKDKIINSKKEWNYLPFFTESSYIPILHFDTLSYYDRDIALNQIVLTTVSFKSNIITEYKFLKDNNIWNLTEILEESIDKVPDYDFVTFLKTFSSDSTFQLGHILFPLSNYFADSNNDYETIHDFIDESKWKHLNVVADIENIVILNIANTKSNYRNIFFRGVENGIWIKYTFRKNGNTWELIKLEDYST